MILPRPGLISIALLFLFGVFRSAPVFADTLETIDGSSLHGTVTKMIEGKVYFETAFAGELVIPWEQVSSLETSDSLPIHLSDGSILPGTIRKLSGGRMEIVQNEREAPSIVQAQDIVAIAPPPDAPSVKWKGQFVGNLSATDGNSDTNSIGASAEITRRGESDRINFRGGVFYTEDEGETTRDDLFIAGKYDYFLGKNLFAYTVARFDRDTLKELDLRTTAGAGLGYQFLEDVKFELSGEMGLSYVDEDFSIDADDTSYVALRSAYNFDWWVIKQQLLYGQDFEFLLGLEDVEDWLAIWDNALTWKLSTQWSTNASIRFEYDNTPASGLDELDTRYILGVGYSF